MEGLRIQFEQPFNYTKAREWSASVQNPTIWVTFLYLVAVFGTKSLMTNRKPLDLRKPLQLWNLGLAVYSIAAFLVASKEIVAVFLTKGFSSTYLDIPNFYSGPNGAWAFAFVLSKYVELGDTAFLVLRKRPVMLMHWLHHTSTLNMVLAGYAHDTHLYSWLLWMNTFVHSLMYSYYFLASCGYRLPASTAKKLTTMQIIQFCIGLSILVHILLIKLSSDYNPHCNWRMWFGTLYIEVTYLVLFSRFYYESYVKDGGKKFVRDKTEGKTTKTE